MTVTDDGRIEVHEHFDCSQQELWETISAGERLSEWFGGAVSIEPRVGGLVRFDLPSDGVLATGVVRAWKPPQPGFTVAHLEHTFVDAKRPDLASVCSWAVVQADEGCDLHFIMDGAGEIGALLFEPRVGEPSAEDARAALEGASSVLLVDWLGDETPSTIARVAPVTYGKVGPKPDDWALVEPDDSERGYRTTRIPMPQHSDLLHLDWTLGFDEFVEVAMQLGVKTFWYHSGRTHPAGAAQSRGCWVPSRQSARQRQIVERVGMRYIDNQYIVDTARAVAATR